METDQIFETLKSFLNKYEPKLVLVHDKKDNYYLNTKIIGNAKKGEFFGAVQIKKNYVAFHLMPVYYFPELLDKVSDSLKKQMQGKSCFNFKTIDKALFKELKLLTSSSFKKYKSEEKIL